MPPHRRSRRGSAPLAACLALALALAVAACGDDADGTSPPPTDEEAPRVTPDDAAATVELLESGAEPRDELRLDLEPGTTGRATMEVRTVSSQMIDGEPAADQPDPSFRVVLRTEVAAVEDETAELRFGYESFEVVNADDYSPEAIEGIRRELAALDDVSGTLTVTDLGVGIAASFDAPPGLDPTIAETLDQLGQQVRQLSVPFPEEPVGLGARWRVHTDLAFQGVSTVNETTYTLVSRDGPDYVLEVAQVQRADDQELPVPGGGPDARLELVDYDVDGGGRIEGSTDALLPRTSGVRTAGTIAFAYSDPAAEPPRGEIVQQLEIDVRLGRDG